MVPTLRQAWILRDQLRVLNIPAVFCDFLICFWFWLDSYMGFRYFYAYLLETNKTQLIELGIEAEIFLSWLKNELPNVSCVRLPTTLWFAQLDTSYEELINDVEKTTILNQIADIHKDIYQHIYLRIIVPPTWELPDQNDQRILHLTFSEGHRPSRTQVRYFFTNICGVDSVENLDIEKPRDGSSAYGHVMLRRFLHAALIMRGEEEVTFMIAEFEMCCKSANPN